MAAELRDQLGEALGKNYAIERELGGGGMSRVFLARDLTLDRLVVVKVLSAESSAGVSVDRFRREIQVIAKLQHPHVVPLVSAGSSAGGLYYVMPFFGGETLRARVAREGPMAIADAVRVLREVLDALSFAHSHGVIHRDIKPDNILLEAGHAVVADFGVAKALKESGNVTSAGIALGTPAYMAPEQASADPSADHRADLYAVGVVAYEMLSGAPPFEGAPSQVIRAHMATNPTPILQRRSDVPEPLAKLVMQALEKEPKDRPQSAREMLGALETVASPGATGTHVTGSSASARRFTWPVVGGVAAGLMIVVLGAWQFLRPAVVESAQSMAIMPFSVATGDTTLVRLGQNLVTTISANLDGVGDIHTADAMSVLRHARDKGSLLSLADAIAIAKSVGARGVVHGTLAPSGATVRADAAIYDSQNGNLIARVSAAAPSDSLAAMTDSLTWGLLRAVWNKGSPPTPHVGSITTHNPVALREFLEGERFFARALPTEAAEAYKRAIAIDTAFWFAHYRYRVSAAWFGATPDTQVTNRLNRHLPDLPERERGLVAVYAAVLTGTERVRALEALTNRYPDYAPAWLALGDYLIHNASRAGHDVRDAIQPWRRVTELMPGDMEAVNHLAMACAAAGDIPCARAANALHDSLVLADSAPSRVARINRQFFNTALGTSRQVDSIVSKSNRDTVWNPWFPFRMAFATVSAERPGLQSDWDRESERSVAMAMAFGLMSKDEATLVSAIDRQMRGDWSSVDTAVAIQARLTRPGGLFASPLTAIRGRVLAELQEFTKPDPRTADIALSLAGRANLAPLYRTEAIWIAGLNALLRGDSASLRRQLQALAADTAVRASIATRSLRGIALGRSGRRAAAAESLLVLEREHGENLPKVWGALSADRILAAQWLADDKRYAAADSLLRFTRGYGLGSHAETAVPVFSSAQLLRSRIAEGLGNSAEAVTFAKIFLANFDLAPASQKPLLDEARSRIARLQPSDAPRPAP